MSVSFKRNVVAKERSGEEWRGVERSGEEWRGVGEEWERSGEEWQDTSGE